MRKLNTLKRGRPAQEQRPSASAWGARQAVLLLGVIVTLAGAAWAAYLVYNRPRIVPIGELTPVQSWALVWTQELRPGVAKAPPWEESYLEHLKWYHRWLGAAGAIAGVGLITMASSLLIPKRGPRRRRRPGQKPPPRRR